MEIEKNALFHGIESGDLQRMLVCSRARMKTYRRGDVLFLQGDTPYYLYVLMAGKVTLVRNLISGRKNIFFEVEEGDVFGEQYFFNGEKSYWYGAEVSARAEVLEIPMEFFSCFCNETCGHHRQLVQNMLNILAQKEWATMQKMHILSPTSLKGRIAIWLLEEADGEGVVKLTMNREALANYLGVARPSLSRTLMKLQEEKIIAVDKKEIRILNKDFLDDFYN